MGAAPTAVAPERELEDLVARQLVAEGYDVVVQPGWDDLPPDIARFQPDLLARKDDRIVVVEVKSRQPDGSARSRVEALAEAVRSHPDLHFKLVIGPPDEAPVGWSREETAQRIAQARSLVRDGYAEAALLLAWSACEAAARMLAHHEELDVQRWQPSTMFYQLVHAGLLDNVDLRKIEDARTARNRLSHGLSGVADAASLALSIAGVAENLLRELDVEAEPAAAGS